jgi:hypothetical protein
MFKRFDVHIASDLTCNEPIYEINKDDFRYYDKDGFELNVAEQKYYRMMRYPIDHPILNHTCWQEPWFELEDDKTGLILDHCMILQRCRYIGHAAYQLRKIKEDIPNAELLLNTKAKWGYDFALDAVDPNGHVYEVLHVEYDHTDYEIFKNHMYVFDYTIRHTDWIDAAKRIYQQRDQWQDLKGFDQNNWKANYLLGWQRAEFTEKTLSK